VTRRNPYRGDDPQTPGQLYDLLQYWFGVGAGGTNWLDERIREISKIKRLIASRHTSVQQLHIAAKYCRDHRISVYAASTLCTHLRDALAEDKARKAKAQQVELTAQVANAIEWERDNYPGDDRWVDQFVRAHQDEDRKDVLKRWRLGRRQFTKS
jgi:hypothetical protein